MDERLPVQRLPVARMRGVRTTGLPGPERVGPVDLTLEAGTLVALRPASRGRVVMDVLQGVVGFRGEVEVIGRRLRPGPDVRPGPLRRVSLGPDGDDHSAAAFTAPAPAGASTVRQALQLGASRPPLGPALPLRTVLDVRMDDLDAADRGLVTIARALREQPDVLLVDAEALGSASTVAARLAGPLADLVALEGRTVLVAADHPALWRPADIVLTIPAA